MYKGGGEGGVDAFMHNEAVLEIFKIAIYYQMEKSMVIVSTSSKIYS